MKNKRIVYVGRVGTPVNAPGIRIYNIAKVLREIGYEVDFICDREDYSGQTLKSFDGFNYYYNKCTGKSNVFQSVKNVYELVFADKIFGRVEKYCKKYKPDAIILYNDVYALTKKLIKYCKQNRIRLIADVTEWYEKRKFNKIGDKIVPYLTDKRIRKLDQKVCNIISISPYLHSYYLDLGCNSIFVPPTFDVPKNIEIKKYHYYQEPVLNLVYAGSPGSKDILVPILNAIEILNRDKITVRLDLVGLDASYLKRVWKELDFNELAIIAHGRLTHAETLKIVRRADFGILLRYQKRYAKAGFSTKFVECMSYGVPMICNSVGGADALIDSMNNGIIVENYNVNTLTNLFSELTSYHEKDIIRIRENAYEKALTLFDRTNYKELFNQFLKR
ncbi:glycosyltransferase [Peribacillus asahii]|uniref:glycosyltransferase n=1 Tax=Peribacillus asahii TaxID=228899 RepID=UPI002079B406|nr:glycosyltransferase [Peribacillus asahii]USK84916.1 glycosyltransferase [Peribacillus asahii]